MWIGTNSFDLIQWRALRPTEPLFGAAVGPSPPRRRDQICELRVGGAVPQRLTQIGAPLRIETEEPGPIGGKPAAIARAAERGGCRCDDPKCAAVRQPETLGRRAGIVRADGRDGAVASRQDLEHLALRHDLLRGPSRGAADVHVLDEPDL